MMGPDGGAKFLEAMKRAAGGDESEREAAAQAARAQLGDLAGVIPRAVDQLFEYAMNAPETVEFTLGVSYVEVYMERIRDLLDVSKTNLQVGQNEERGVYVKGAKEVFVTSPAEMYAVMADGSNNRAVAATGMNEGSSRSHAIFCVSVQQRETESGAVKTGRLFLCDLAGSETAKKTGVRGQQLEEAKKINQSLSALGNVINALTDGRSSHVPYRNSKLTRILEESLGGNSRTVLLINASPAQYNAAETLSTMRFGRRAKLIKNKAVAHVQRSPKELEALLERAEQQLAAMAAREQLWCQFAASGTAPAELQAWLSSRGQSVSSDVQAMSMPAPTTPAAKRSVSCGSHDVSSDGSSVASAADEAAAEELAAARARVDELSATVTSMSEVLSEAEKELGTLKSRLEQREQDAQSAAEAKEELASKVEQLEQDIASKVAALDGASAQLSAAQEAADKQRAHARELEVQRDALEEQLRKAADAAAVAEAQSAAMRQAAKDALAEASVASKVQAIEARVHRRSTASSSGGAQGSPEPSPEPESATMSATTGPIDALREQMDKLRAEAADNASALAAAQAESKLAAQHLEEAQATLATTKAEAGALRGELEAAQAELSAAKGGLTAATSELRELRPKHKATLSQLGDLRKQATQLRAQLAHMEEQVNVEREQGVLHAAAQAAQAAVAAALTASGLDHTPEMDDGALCSVTLWEHQRHYPLGGWSDQLEDGDPPAWAGGATHEEALESGVEVHQSDMALPGHGWQWVGDWHPQLDGDVDPEGWQYSSEFTGFESAKGSAGPSASANLLSSKLPSDSVRRRAWTRMAALVDLSEEESLAAVDAALLQRVAQLAHDEPDEAASAADIALLAKSRAALQRAHAQYARITTALSHFAVAAQAKAAKLSGELVRKGALQQDYEARIGDLMSRLASATSAGEANRFGHGVRTLTGGGGEGRRTLRGGGGAAGTDGDAAGGDAAQGGVFSSLFSKIRSSLSPTKAPPPPPEHMILELAARGDTDGCLGMLQGRMPDGSPCDATGARNACDKMGRNAVLIAARVGHMSTLDALISEGGMDMNSKDEDARTALHYAARRGQLDVAVFLLSKGLRVNSTDVHALTALHQAALGCHVHMAELLLHKGAKPLARDTNGRTPLKLARRFAADANASNKADWAALITLLTEWTEKAASAGPTAATEPPSA